MTTKTAASDTELRQFRKLVNLMKKMPMWGEDPVHAKLMKDLCTDTSKEARDVRDIMWRMVGAEIKAKKAGRLGSSCDTRTAETKG